MKVLFINQTYYPDVVATAQQLQDAAEKLVAKGYDVTVISGRKAYGGGPDLHLPKEEYRGVKIIRIWPFSFQRQKNKGGRVLDTLGFQLALFWKLLWMPRFDKVIGMTSPPLVGFVAALFSKIRKSEFVYWVMDVNPDQAIEAGWIREGSFKAKFLEKGLRSTIKWSETIIVLDDFMKERFIGKGADLEKIKVVPPWAHNEDLETIPHEENPFRKKHHLEGKFIIMYSGNHSICHPLDTLLNAALILKDDPDIVFMFVGGGERVHDVLQFKKRNQLENILYFNYVSRCEIKNSLSSADIHVAVMGEPYVGIVHPCKIYSILEIGRSFIYIGPKSSHIGNIIDAHGVGYHVDHNEGTRLTSYIKMLKSSSEEEKKEIMEKEKEIAKLYSTKRLSRFFIDSLLKDNELLTSSEIKEIKEYGPAE